MQDLPRTFHLDALILKHMDYGEADRIMVVYSKEQGKVRALARGVRKMNSRKAGHLEPFTHTQIFMARGRDMPIITQAQTIDPFNGIRNNLIKIGYASYVIELTDRFSSEDGANFQLFQLLLGTIDRIDHSEDLFNPIRYFELQLLELQGFKPELFACVKCKKTIQAEDQYFSAELGGALCPNCGLTTALVYTVSMTTLKYLRHFQRSSYQTLLRVKPPGNVRKEMETLMHHYIMFLLERRLNSPDFIKVVEHLKAIKYPDRTL
jgi:DNA repair protein RecO (recombination protein O)